MNDTRVAITGGTSGLGLALVHELRRRGARVAFVARTRERVDQIARDHPGTHGIVGDVARKEHIHPIALQIIAALGGLDVLVNNAGVYPRVPFLDMRESDWDLVLDVNLKGGFFCAQAAARAMIAGHRRGSVINMASQAIRGAVRGVHYSASKGGVVAMTRAMALELAPHGIRVNAIAPGLTDTAQPRYGNTEDELAVMARAVPLGRMAQPDDIAGIAVFLASEEAGHVTGQTVHVNGGSFMP